MKRKFTISWNDLKNEMKIPNWNDLENEMKNRNWIKYKNEMKIANGSYRKMK